MSTPRGIFETYHNAAAPAAVSSAAQTSPFAVPAESLAESPFASANANPAQVRKESPFSVVSVAEPQEDSKTIRLPERRKPVETPFQIAEPQVFGFEAAPQVARANSPETAPQPQFRASPFELSPQTQHSPPPSPFAVEQAPVAPAPYPAHVSPYGGWAQNEAAHVQPAYTPQPPPQVQAPAPQYPLPPAGQSDSDSFQIKQLELRAIFGVDREMSKDEIIQRARSLPGVRQIAMVSASDIAAVDALKQVINNLGFGNGALKLYSGSVPIEFIREGHTLLAVQTDGGFAPGVRETLMLVARELSR
jgi:hypothetical protein